MVQTVQGSLTLLNPHSPAPQLYWNGQVLAGVRRVHIHVDEDDSRVKVVLSGTQDDLYAEMVASGITVKKVAT